jgi:hypothetical protein
MYGVSLFLVVVTEKYNETFRTDCTSAGTLIYPLHMPLPAWLAELGVICNGGSAT